MSRLVGEDIYGNEVIRKFRCKAAKILVKYDRFNVEAAAMDILFCRLQRLGEG